MKLKRTRILAILPLMAALFLAQPTLRAEEHAAPAAEHQVHETATPAAHGETTKGEEAHGEGKAHHVSVKLFGIELNRLAQFGIQVFNFSIFAGVIIFLLKGALASAFKARTQELTEQLNQAERDKAEGEAQLKELEAKMAGLQAELESILAKAEADAEAERARILEAAREESAAILTQAQAEIESQKRLAEKALRNLVAELALEGATARLKAQLQGPVAEQALDHAIKQVGGMK
jgi:F-type H+-transporting ATPase subunit b